jgi:hypothetical protein
LLRVEAERKLKDNLRRTIDEETTADEERQELDSLLSRNGWAIEVVPGAPVHLSKTVGADRIDVEVLASEDIPCDEPGHEHAAAAEEEGDNVDDESAENPMQGQHDHFVVKVTNTANSSLQFKCLAQDGVLKISKVAIQDKNGDVGREMPFDELPEDTQVALEEYLVERSLNDDMARIIYLSVNRYDQAYFIDWMHRVVKFLPK